MATGLPHRGAGGDELGEVFIRGHHEGLHGASFFGLRGEGSDDVIRLIAIELDHGDIKGGTELFDLRDSEGELLGHGIALSFILRVSFMASGGG